LTLHYKTFTHLLYQTAHAWRLAVDRHLKHSGLSMSSWMAIGLIASETRPLTQTELAQMLGLEDASMVPLIDRLVKQELLSRVQPPEDRRKRHLVLTEKGNQAFALVKKRGGRAARRSAGRYRSASAGDHGAGAATAADAHGKYVTWPDATPTRSVNGCRMKSRCCRGRPRRRCIRRRNASPLA